MSLSKILATVAMIEGLMLAANWRGGEATPAYAQIPDAGAQRMQLVEEMKALNGKMDRLLKLLEDGQLQVKLAKPDVEDKAPQRK